VVATSVSETLHSQLLVSDAIFAIF
jgi:hypothetical protein